MACWIFIENHLLVRYIYVYSLFLLENLIFEFVVEMVSILWLWAFEGCINIEFSFKNGILVVVGTRL